MYAVEVAVREGLEEMPTAQMQGMEESDFNFQ
jgi:hypothetical protein